MRLCVRPVEVTASPESGSLLPLELRYTETDLEANK